MNTQLSQDVLDNFYPFAAVLHHNEDSQKYGIHRLGFTASLHYHGL